MMRAVVLFAGAFSIIGALLWVQTTQDGLGSADADASPAAAADSADSSGSILSSLSDMLAGSHRVVSINDASDPTIDPERLREIEEGLADPERAKETLNSMTAHERAALTMTMVREAEKFSEQEKNRSAQSLAELLDTSPIRRELRAKVEAWKQEGKDIRVIYMLASQYADEHGRGKPRTLRQPVFKRAPASE